MTWFSGVLVWIEAHQGLAAWVQAIFSVVAIIAAIELSRLQFRHAQRLQLQQLKAEGVTVAEAIEKISAVAVNVVAYTCSHLRDRSIVEKIIQGNQHFDLQALLDVESALNSIPKHQISSELVAYVFMLSGTVRQVRELAQRTLRRFESIDDIFFNELFESLTKLQLSLSKTNDDIIGAVKVMRER